MPPKKSDLIFSKVTEEQFQQHSTRANLYTRIEKHIGLPIISFYTSFIYPVMIEDHDVDLLEGLLQKCNLEKGFVLMISSPGGSGLAAERIINICRSYSGTGEYIALVPGKAKSAATMLCLGASKLLMAKTAELGAIDPQLTVAEGNRTKRFSIFNIVKSYEHLFNKAVTTSGNLQPFLQQLSNYDEREIEEYRMLLSLSEDIALKALKTGMLSRFKKTDIKQKLKIFLTPETVKTHGRAIHPKEALNCLKKVDILDLKDKLWASIYELHFRLTNYVSTNKVAKCIECHDHSFVATVNQK